MPLKIKIFFAICILALQVRAQERFLHIILKSGSYVSLPVADQPMIVFDKGVMYVGSESFLVSNVSKYIVGTEDDVTGVDKAAKDGLRIDASDAANGKVQIENYNGQEIRMYDASGVEVPCKVTAKGSTAMVDYTALPIGIYLLSVGDETIKIQKR